MAENKVSDVEGSESSGAPATASNETAPLREWRLRRHLSHRQLSKLADVTTYTLLRIEKGKPTRPLTKRRIADALGLIETQISEFLHELQPGDSSPQADTKKNTG